MSICASSTAQTSRQRSPEETLAWNVFGGIVALAPGVQVYLSSRHSLRTAIAQWESTIRSKFAPANVYAQVDLCVDPDTNAKEIMLVVSVDRPGPEARRLLDQIIDAGLPPEAEEHFDEVDIVLIGNESKAEA